MTNDLRIGIAGATGAVGSEVLRVLDRAPWRPSTVVPLARPTTSVSHVEYGDQRVPVDDLDVEGLDGLDALILALPRQAARPVGEQAVQEGMLVVDLSGAFAEDDDVPLVVPWINPEALEDRGRGVVAAPSGPALLLASALGPLRRAGISGPVVASVFLPASSEGRGGIEELSRQVVALLNSQTPPRRVFPQGLAFDLVPEVGRALGTGWTDREQAVGGELNRLLGIDDPIDITLVGVPVFSGMAASLLLRSDRQLPPELATRILRDGGLKVPEEEGSRYVPRPRRVEGQPFAHGGRIRTSADGKSLHVWLSMDNLRACATVAVGLCGALLRQ